jgi:serine-type D-Ala-D-Ala carboxypeptidase (penicillin-binding protein 5/6)
MLVIQEIHLKFAIVSEECEHEPKCADWMTPVLRPIRGNRVRIAIAAGAAAAATATLALPAVPAAAEPGSGTSVQAARTARSAQHARHTQHAARHAASHARHTGVSVPSDIRAFGAELYDVTTGTRLWSKKLHVPRPIGSITKVMTALVVLQAGDLNRKITVTRAAIRYVRRDGASSAGLIRGDVLTARQLLEAMLVPSGCDAAYLLATAYGPGRPAFVRKMNDLAKTLGLTSTHFAGFDGMPFPTEYSTYSTPANLLRLGEAAMKYPLFRQIVRQKSYLLHGAKHHHRYFWTSTNLLLGSYPGTLGIKTGSTLAAGDCLLFEARRGSQTLIGVVLHANPTNSVLSRFIMATRLLNWGFRHS